MKGDTVIVVDTRDRYVKRSGLKVGDITTVTEVGSGSIRVYAPNSDGNWWIESDMFKPANPVVDGGWEAP